MTEGGLFQDGGLDRGSSSLLFLSRSAVRRKCNGLCMYVYDRNRQPPGRFLSSLTALTNRRGVPKKCMGDPSICKSSP